MDPNLHYGIDIETSTRLVLGPRGEPNYNPGLDPLRGYVTDVALALAPGHPMATHADPTAGGDAKPDAIVLALDCDVEHAGEREIEEAEADLLTRLDTILRALEPGVLDGWNSAFFDVPFLHTRARHHQWCGNLPAPGSSGTFGLEIFHDDALVPKYGPLPDHGPDYQGLDGAFGHSGGYQATWHTTRDHHEHRDVCFDYLGYAAEHGIRHSLKPVGEHLGLQPVVVADRARVSDLTQAERDAYVASDSRTTRRAALRVDGVKEWRTA